ncbi:hypothetical protein ACKWTF_012599 [Chironomus riparius]
MSRCRKELDEKIQREGSYEFVEDDLVTILPVWRPANQSGNAILNHQFFRAQFAHCHLCMIFPLKLHKKGFEVCEEHPKGLLDCGFYKGKDFDNCKQICKTVERFVEFKLTSRNKIILTVLTIFQQFYSRCKQMNQHRISCRTK